MVDRLHVIPEQRIERPLRAWRRDLGQVLAQGLFGVAARLLDDHRGEDVVRVDVPPRGLGDGRLTVA
ncbi:MAG: hypothetical protein ACREE5_05300 [Acetobacteraceae bacterium]